MKALIWQPANSPTSEPHEGKKNSLSRDNRFLAEVLGRNEKLDVSQASIPPSSGRTLVIPSDRSSIATWALVASLGHSSRVQRRGPEESLGCALRSLPWRSAARPAII